MTGSLRGRNVRRAVMVPVQALVLPLAYAFPRRRGLWLFAYQLGYKDNPRYQFEQVVAAAPPGVRPVWFAQTREEEAAVRATGRPAVWKRRPRGWLLQLRAGVVVIGSGLGELNRPLVGRARIVQTWHGAPFKRIHADFPQGDDVVHGGGPVADAVNGVVRRIVRFTRSRVAMVPSQSEVVAARYQSAFGIGPAATPVVGTPRADVIGRRGPEADDEARRARESVLPPDLHGATRFLLYAPTWRDFGSEDVLKKGLDVAALEALLCEHDAVLLIRMHPHADPTVFEAVGAAPGSRIVVRSGSDVDINVLLRAVDFLITDYSAISVDFALLGRPILYFMPDLAAYEGARGLYESPSLLTGGLHSSTWDELLRSLASAFADPSPYVAATESMADRYWGHRDTESCARIMAEVLRLTGLDRAAP